MERVSCSQIIQLPVYSAGLMCHASPDTVRNREPLLVRRPPRSCYWLAYLLPRVRRGVVCVCSLLKRRDQTKEGPLNRTNVGRFLAHLRGVRTSPRGCGTIRCRRRVGSWQIILI